MTTSIFITSPPLSDCGNTCVVTSDADVTAVVSTLGSAVTGAPPETVSRLATGPVCI